MNKLICVLAVILYVGSAANVGFAQSSEIPSNETLELWGEFKAKYGNSLTVRWNKHTDSPGRIFGVPIKVGAGAADSSNKAQEISWKFISDNKELLKVNLDDLTLKRAVETPNVWKVEYEQDYNGVPVKYSRVFVVIAKDGDIELIDNVFYPNISISTTPKISKDKAINIAKKRMGVGIPVVKYATLEVLPPQSDDSITYYLTWEVRLSSIESFLERAYFIDAITGEIIKERDMASNVSMSTRAVSLAKTLLLRALPWIIGVVAVLSVVLFSWWKRK